MREYYNGWGTENMFREILNSRNGILKLVQINKDKQVLVTWPCRDKKFLVRVEKYCANFLTFFSLQEGK